MSSKSFKNASNLNGVVTVLQFGAVGDGVTDDTAAIQAAIASNLPIHFPTGTYKYTSTIAISGYSKQITSDFDAHLRYTGTQCAISLTGYNHYIQIADVNAPNAPYVVKYYDLIFSRIDFHTIGDCSEAVIFHDGTLQTAAEGSNRWIIDILQAGGAKHGIFLKASATQGLEGEQFDVRALFSADVSSVKIGEAGLFSTIAYNELNVTIDSQNITPLLVDCFANKNYIYLRCWGQNVAPGSKGVTFNTGSSGNILYASTGIGELVVTDNGQNYASYPGLPYEHVYSGNSIFTANISTGTEVVRVENRSIANNSLKYAGLSYYGRDTTNSGKNTASIRAYPLDGNCINSKLAFFTRNSDSVNTAFEIYNDGSVIMAGSTLRMFTPKTPASSSAAGDPGQICWDSNYIYTCVATNTWKRSPLSTW